MARSSQRGTARTKTAALPPTPVPETSMASSPSAPPPSAVARRYDSVVGTMSTPKPNAIHGHGRSATDGLIASARRSSASPDRRPAQPAGYEIDQAYGSNT